MSQIGALSVKIGADTKDLTKGLSAAKGEIGGLDSSIKNMLPSIKQIAVVGAAAATALAVMVKRAIDTADNMGKAAQKVGVTTEELSKLEFAAKLANVSSGELQSSLMRLTKGMSDAAQGTGEAQKGFSALGIQVKSSDGSLKSSTQVMEEVADRFAGMKDGAEKTALAISIFGRAGANMIPLLNGGSKAIREAGDELERMGGVVTADAARNAQMFNDNLARLSKTVSSIAYSIAENILPVLVEFSNRVMVAINANLGFFRTLRLLATGASSYQEQIGKLEKQIEDLDKTANSSWLGARGLQRGDRDSALRERINAEIKALKQLQAMQEELSKPFQAPSGTAPSLLGDSDKLKDSMDEHVKLYFDFIERQRQIDEQRKLQLAQNVEAFRFSMLSEEEALGETYAKRIEMLQEHFGAEFEMSDQYHELRLAAEQDFMNRMGDIRKRGMTDIERFTQMSYSSQAKTIAGMLQQMTASVAGQSREMFNINKAASLANAVIKGYESIQNAYAFGSKFAGPAGGAAMAAIAAAATAVQIRGIASQRFNSGGGSTAPSVAASTPAGAIPVSAVGGGGGGGGGGSSGQTVTIQLQGEVFNREQVRNLITQINEAVSDGSVLRLQ
jgi:hypothetical protein